MASSGSWVEKAPLSNTPRSAPDIPLEAAEPGITVSLLEISSPHPSCWGSLPPPMNTSHYAAGPLTTQKLQDLLRDLQDVLQSVADLGGITHTKESSEETKMSKDGSEPQDTAGEPGKAEGMVSKTLLLCFDLEERQGGKEQEMTLESQKPSNTSHLSARPWEKHSEENSVLSKAQLQKEEGVGSTTAQEENAELRHNMEQLLQEAEHWSQQHTELSQLLRSYQQSQRGRRAAMDSHWAWFYSQQHSQRHSHVYAGQMLQAAVRRLNQDTHSLHLAAALLENEYQILQHRVQLLEESYQPWEGTAPENPPQRNQLSKNSQRPLEKERVESNLPYVKGTFPKKDPVYRSSDPCLNRKAQNNRFNTRIARAVTGRKRPTSGFR
ncbi:spermatogenic leucine zipper protein 1 [Cavia porcellus]|uniref:spermatogenic leucine zipper protein 1 n=1 Tax=Cavia porcellus TaxID=10141 RepID=UPI0006619D18|nr:spermatogenic leucine zipper protein 1 [Cavia porcellus]